jgi:hypothetical protein
MIYLKLYNTLYQRAAQGVRRLKVYKKDRSHQRLPLNTIVRLQSPDPANDTKNKALATLKPLVCSINRKQQIKKRKNKKDVPFESPFVNTARPFICLNRETLEESAVLVVGFEYLLGSLSVQDIFGNQL